MERLGPLPTKKLLSNIGPELRQDVRQCSRHQARTQTRYIHTSVRATGGIVSIRKGDAHRHSENTSIIESWLAGVRPSDHNSAYSVAESGPKSIFPAPAKVARIFVEQRREHCITEEILVVTSATAAPNRSA